MCLSKSLVLFFSMVNIVIACEIKACYYRNGAALRPQPYTVTPEMLNPQHCTVMIYAFANIKDNKLKNSLTADEDTPGTKGLYRRFTDLKSTYKHLTMLLSVGGWNFGPQLFVQMSSTPETRKIFIDHAVQFLRERNFDGLDLHWEFPVHRYVSTKDKIFFTLLVQEMKAAFERESNMTGRPRLKLTAALAGDVRANPNSYEIDKISKELDFVGIMTYDYSRLHTTIHPSPIYGDSADDTLNINYTVEYYLQRGVPKNKMVIGLPLYGRGYNADSSKWNYRTEAWGRIAYSYATGLDSIFAYFEVMFAKRHGLAGVMVWSLDMDDVQKKFCRKPTKNLIETIQETCASEVAISSVDPPLPHEDPKLLWPYTHPFPLYKKPLDRDLTNEAATVLCKGKTGNLIIPYPGIDCQRYIRCYNGLGKVQTCSSLMAYDPEVNHCNWQVFVPQCRAYIYTNITRLLRW